jgi:hypothetical protein
MLSCRSGFNPTTSSKYLVIFVYWRERQESLKILSSLVTDSDKFFRLAIERLL